MGFFHTTQASSPTAAESTSTARRFRMPRFSRRAAQNRIGTRSSVAILSTKYLDEETGLYNYGYRYYSPQLGRWVNRDQVYEQGGINLFVALENNALNYTDARGLYTLYIVPASRQTAITGVFNMLSDPISGVPHIIAELNSWLMDAMALPNTCPHKAALIAELTHGHAMMEAVNTKLLSADNMYIGASCPAADNGHYWSFPGSLVPSFWEFGGILGPYIGLSSAHYSNPKTILHELTHDVGADDLNAFTFSDAATLASLFTDPNGTLLMVKQHVGIWRGDPCCE